MPRPHAHTPLAAALLLSIAGTAAAQTLIQTPDSGGQYLATFIGGAPLASLADFQTTEDFAHGAGTTEINGPGVVQFNGDLFYVATFFPGSELPAFVLRGGVDFRMPGATLLSGLASLEFNEGLLLVDGSSVDVGSVERTRPDLHLINGSHMRIRDGELRIGRAPTFVPNTDVQVRDGSVLRHEGETLFRTDVPGVLPPAPDLVIDGGVFDTNEILIDLGGLSMQDTSASARMVEFTSGTFRVRSDVTLSDTLAEVLLGRTSADGGLRSLVAGQTLELLGSNNVVDSANFAIDGGRFVVGDIDFTASSPLNFLSGELEFRDARTIDAGLLSNITGGSGFLGPDRGLSFQGAGSTLAAPLTLDGGTLRLETAGLTVSAPVTFTSGTMELTTGVGAAVHTALGLSAPLTPGKTLRIGDSGALAAPVTVAGGLLEAAGDMSVNAGTTLNVTGGRFDADGFENNGTTTHTGGVLDVDAVVNNGQLNLNATSPTALGVVRTQSGATTTFGANARYDLTALEAQGGVVVLGSGARVDAGALGAGAQMSLASGARLSVDAEYFHTAGTPIADLADGSTLTLDSIRVGDFFSPTQLTTGEGTLRIDGAIAPDNLFFSSKTHALGGALSIANEATTTLAMLGTAEGDLFAGWDQYLAEGDVRLGGDLLFDNFGSASLPDGFFVDGSEYLLIGIGGERTGWFANFGEGAFVDSRFGVDLFISYFGGDGNDVVLTTAPIPAPGAAVLLGLAGVVGARRRRS